MKKVGNTRDHDIYEFKTSKGETRYSVCMRGVDNPKIIEKNRDKIGCSSKERAYNSAIYEEFKIDKRRDNL